MCIVYAGVFVLRCILSDLVLMLLLLSLCFGVPLLFLYMFFATLLTGGFHWSLNNSKSPQLSKTISCILASFGNAVVWTVLFLLQITGSPSTFLRFFEIVPEVQLWLVSLSTSCYKIFSPLRQGPGIFPVFFFLYILWSAGTAKSTYEQVLFFLLIKNRSGLLASIGSSIFVSKS